MYAQISEYFEPVLLKFQFKKFMAHKIVNYSL